MLGGFWIPACVGMTIFQCFPDGVRKVQVKGSACTQHVVTLLVERSRRMAVVGSVTANERT
jgi:hypothetical protein